MSKSIPEVIKEEESTKSSVKSDSFFIQKYKIQDCTVVLKRLKRKKDKIKKEKRSVRLNSIEFLDLSTVSDDVQSNLMECKVEPSLRDNYPILSSVLQAASPTHVDFSNVFLDSVPYPVSHIEPPVSASQREQIIVELSPVKTEIPCDYVGSKASSVVREPVCHYVCVTCNCRHDTHLHFEAHVAQTHVNIPAKFLLKQLYQCTTCSLKFPSKSLFYCHVCCEVRGVVKMLRFGCACGQTFSSTAELSGHLRGVDQGHTASQVVEQLMTQCDLCHLPLEVSDLRPCVCNQPCPPVQEGTRLFVVCRLCSLKCTSVKNMRAHIASFHRLASDNLKFQNLCTKNCKACDAWFFSELDLRNHYNWQHRVLCPHPAD